MTDSRIALVGTGNVASHLAEALGSDIDIIVSRDRNRAAVLAEKYGIDTTGTYSDLIAARPDIVIVSIADHAINDVAQTKIGRASWRERVF